MVDYRELESGSLRIDHENVGEVSRTSFAYGKITEFNFEKLNPITPDDTCTVEIEGGGTKSGIPIFYHCKKDFYFEDDPVITEAKGLKGAAWAFKIDQRVKVMLVDQEPVAVLTHYDYPRYCHNNIYVKVKPYYSASHEAYFDLQKQKTVSAGDRETTEYPEKIRGFHGYWQEEYRLWLWLVDVMFSMGPVLFILSAHPVPVTDITGYFKYYFNAAPYSKELEDSTRALGLSRDAAEDKTPTWPGFTMQSGMTSLLDNTFNAFTGEVMSSFFYIYYQNFLKDQT